MKHSFILGCLLFPLVAQAANLSEIIDRRIEEKAGTEKPKDEPIQVPAVISNAPSVVPTGSAPASKASDSIEASDIKIIGIMGVGHTLRARVVVKDSQPIVATEGQAIQDGWVLASLTPNAASFELRKPIKTTKKQKQGFKVLKKRQILISGNPQIGEGTTEPNGMGAIH